MAMETATLGGGRFWDLEAVFQQIRGVKSVQSGYAGGHLAYPDYETVCGGETGHAEVVRIQFDTDILSFHHLLEIFFKIHQPLNAATVHGQLASPHRSVIYFHSLEQKNQSQEMVKKLGRLAGCALMTDIKACPIFYLAEEAHQNFYRHHRDDAYCQEFILPKILMSRLVFAKRLAA